MPMDDPQIGDTVRGVPIDGDGEVTISVQDWDEEELSGPELGAEQCIHTIPRQRARRA